VLAVVVLATAAARRNERGMMAAYYQQREVESRNAATEERHVADLAEGKVQSPILPFLNPIGEPMPHRVAAAAHDQRAIHFGRIARVYDDAAARPWRSVDLSAGSP